MGGNRSVFLLPDRLIYLQHVCRSAFLLFNLQPSGCNAPILASWILALSFRLSVPRSRLALARPMFYLYKMIKQSHLLTADRMKMHPAVSCSNYGDAGRRFIDCVYPSMRFLPAQRSLLLLGLVLFFLCCFCPRWRNAEDWSKQLERAIVDKAAADLRGLE